MGDSRRTPTWWRALLWVMAVLLMFGAVVYQRRTGPTYPKKGAIELDGQSWRYSLIRSDWSIKTNDGARVEIPDPGPERVAGGKLEYRRYRTGDDYTALELAREQRDGRAVLVARLPAQPAAGKLEYFIELTAAGGRTLRLPPDQPVVIRFKDHVPG